MVSFHIGLNPYSLVFWAYTIGAFDLMTALIFTVLSFRTICSRLSWLTIFAILFGIFWVSMIVMLIVGIHKRYLRCVRAWIIFSCVGILAEILLIFYAIFNQTSFNKGLVRNGLLLFMGLTVECIFLYIVHRFYLSVAFCTACHKPRTKEPKSTLRNRKTDSASSSRTHTPGGNIVHNTDRSQYNRGNIVQNTDRSYFKGNIVQNTDRSYYENNTHTSANPMRLSFLRSFDTHSAP